MSFLVAGVVTFVQPIAPRVVSYVGCWSKLCFEANCSEKIHKYLVVELWQVNDIELARTCLQASWWKIITQMFPIKQRVVKQEKIKWCTCFALSCALCGAKWCNVCGKMRRNGIHEKFSEHFLLFWIGHDQINAYMTKGWSGLSFMIFGHQKVFSVNYCNFRSKKILKILKVVKKFLIFFWWY